MFCGFWFFLAWPQTNLTPGAKPGRTIRGLSAGIGEGAGPSMNICSDLSDGGSTTDCRLEKVSNDYICRKRNRASIGWRRDSDLSVELSHCHFKVFKHDSAYDTCMVWPMAKLGVTMAMAKLGGTTARVPRMNCWTYWLATARTLVFLNLQYFFSCRRLNFRKQLNI